MAIQLPDVGTGVPADKTGDSPWLAMKKVRENFSNTTHAASRLVGTANGQVATWQSGNIEGTKKDSKTNLLLKSGDSIPDNSAASRGVGIEVGQIPLSEQVFEAVGKTDPIDGQWPVEGDANDVEQGTIRYLQEGQPNTPSKFSLPSTQGFLFRTIRTVNKSRNFQIGWYYTANPTASASLMFRNQHGEAWTPWHSIYNSGNTTVDSNKNIKTSSPVVRVFSDHLDKIHEANNLPIKYTRNGVGDYTIEGTTGLRENDWQIVIPKDDHDNQLVAFTIEDDNGTIRLKTYNRIFSMETFTFGPDLNTPLDIPEGRWVDLHFNDLPYDNEYDTQTEV